MECFCVLQGPQHKLGIKGRRNPSEISAAISGNLKIVEVKCEVVDERVFKILKFLATLGIHKLTSNTLHMHETKNVMIEILSSIEKS